MQKKIITLCLILSTSFSLYSETPPAAQISEIKKMANEGNISAQIKLAEAFFSGNGVPKNSKEAYKWIVVACKSSTGKDLITSTELRDDIKKQLTKEEIQWVEQDASGLQRAVEKNKQAATVAALIKTDVVIDNVIGYFDVEKAPEIIGGLDALYEAIKTSGKSGYSGKVMLGYIVDTSGKAVNIEILSESPKGKGLAEIAIRALQSVTYTPGMHKGAKVAVKMTIPVNIK